MDKRHEEMLQRRAHKDDKHVKRCPTSVAIQEMQINTMMSFYYTERLKQNLQGRVLERTELCRERAPKICKRGLNLWLNINLSMQTEKLDEPGQELQGKEIFHGALSKQFSELTRSRESFYLL